MIMNDKEKIQIYVTELEKRLQQFEIVLAEKHELKIEISEISAKLVLKEEQIREFILLDFEKLMQQNKELKARLEKTAFVNELDSSNYQETQTTEIIREVENVPMDSDDMEFPLVSCSSSSVYAVEPTSEPLALSVAEDSFQEDKNGTKEASCIVEATKTATLKSKPLAVSVADETTCKPWALASGQAVNLMCPECPNTFPYNHLQGHFGREHKAYIKVIRSCKGIPGIVSCNMKLGLWAIGNHFGKHIQQRKTIEEGPVSYRRPPPRQHFLTPTSPFMRPQGPWIPSWQGNHFQVQRQHGPFFEGHRRGHSVFNRLG